MHRRTWLVPIAATALAMAPLGIVSAAQAAPAAAVPTTYYVDPAGNDANTGTSATAAWKSLAKVNGFAFNPGDTVQFKRGGAWTGTLTLSRSGEDGNPIKVAAYGSGNLPKIGGNVLNCVHVTGSYWFIGDLRASGCNWAGFELAGHHIALDTIQADANVVGVSIVDGSNNNDIQWSTIVDNNKMSVNTKPTEPQYEDDDSGAFGFLIHGDDNYIAHNTVRGHFAPSYDYVYDGAAFEIDNGNRNWIEYNVTADNETFTELGRNGTGKTADGNVFAYNSVTSSKSQGSFLVTRGAQSNIGPVTNTEAVNNSVYLPAANGNGWSCFDGCNAGILRLRGNVIQVGGKTGYEDSFDTGNPADSADEDHGVYLGSQTQFTLGPNSVSANPLFTSTTDLRLRSGSPAIGRGEDYGWRQDLAGNSLVGLSRYDAGAYRFLG
ncbi:hypothetical protein AB0J86_06285 [Micromonospora sp. NPDC049559]|uniref:hypothetical protein n=1 Tax=Micromonospora sp. NPDC049559 TaxID=3155923 RepID=UPI003420D572